MQRHDQRAGIFPGPGEGPATGEQQPATGWPGLQGPQHYRPEVLHVLGEQRSLLGARPRKYLLVGLGAQVRPIRDRDHIMAESAQFRRYGGREHLVQQEPDVRPLVHQNRGVETPAFRPGRKRRVTSPEMSAVPIVCSHVPVPAAPHARPAGGAAGPLRARPVRVEPGRRAALPLAPGPGGRAGLPGAVPAAHRRAGGAPVAGRRLPDGAAAGAARLRPGDDGVLRPGEPGRAAVVAQGRAG